MNEVLENQTTGDDLVGGGRSKRQVEALVSLQGVPEWRLSEGVEWENETPFRK
jgi:hypothetical protein